HHIYASDLDLFGRGSLFELLCTVRTRMGEERLAQWLKEPAACEEIRDRQASIAELKDRLDLREELALIGEHADVGVHPATLLESAQGTNRLVCWWIQVGAVLLPVVAIAAGVYWGFTGMGAPFFSVVLIEAAVLMALRSPVDAVLNGSETAF